MKEFGSTNEIVTLRCVTELMLSNRKLIRSHPNYQGEGEWGDWVLHGCPMSKN